jgi:tetratricopeptide (TPR) repeat protein
MRKRGMFAELRWVEYNICAFLYELGEWDEVLEKTADIIAWSKEHQGIYLEASASTLKATVHVWRSQLSEAVTLANSFLDNARTIGDPQALLRALITAAMIGAARSNHERTIELVEEFDVCGRNSPWKQAFLLPDALRLCHTVKAVDLAAALLNNPDPAIKRRKESFLSARAIFAEMEGRFEQGLALYVEAARRWKNFGGLLEQGYARLGAGRCLLAMGEGSAATQPLHDARAIFVRLGAVPLMNEADAYSRQTEAV